MKLSMGCRLLAASALLVLVIDGPVTDAEGKARKVRCKAGKVPIRVDKKTTCRPFAKVFPKPKAIDLRLAHLQQVLKFDPAKKARGRKRKRARTLQSGFGAAGKRAQKKLLKVLPKALALIDRKKHGALSSRLGPGPALASKACQYEEPSPIGHTGGASVGIFGDNGGYIDAPAGGGMRVRLTFLSCGGVTNFSIPQCPTADGSVDAAGTGEFRATIEIWSGSTLVSRTSAVLEDKAKLEGQVGADAKLKHIDVEQTEEAFIVASGGIVIRGGVIRKIRIDMPAGRYDPSQASVVYFGDPISDKSGAAAFASTAQAAIARYREAEPRWSSFDRRPFCAEPVFSPDSNTLKLKKGERKQLSVYAKARADGGKATEAKWTLLNQEKAEFSPESTEAAEPRFNYTVTDAAVGGFVKVTVKLTSTAGVGEKAWFQPTEPPKGIEKITGTFNGEARSGMPGEETIQSWTGSVTLNHLAGATADAPAAGIYVGSDGQVVLQASGIDGSGITGCHQSGSIQAKLPGASMEVTPIGPEGKPPYKYSIVLSMPFQPLEITRSNCPEGAEEFEGTTEDITPLYKLSVSGQESADGKTYFGTKSFMGLTEHWDLTGIE